MSKVVTGLPDLKIDHAGVCKGCAKGNNIKNPFPKSDTKSRGILELIHSYVCGLITSTYLSGYVYYVTSLMITLVRLRIAFKNKKIKYLVNSRHSKP